MSSYPLRLGIVGCGAVVEQFHLPASLITPQVKVTALVDRDLARARALADQFGVSAVYDDHIALVDEVDAVLVATPPQYHAPVACDLMAQGLHVLCEKPMAPGAADCERMIRAAGAANVCLAAAHSRRFHFNLAQIKYLLDLGVLGKVYHARAHDGYAFSWPTATGYMFRGATASGVLLENGIHLLDSLLWFLGPAAALSYADDALGGVESNACLMLRFEGGANAEIHVSRTADLANTIELFGDRGRARCSLYDGRMLELEAEQGKAGSALGKMTLEAPSAQDYQWIMAEQLADFATSAVEGTAPRSGGWDALHAITLIEHCYTLRGAGRILDAAPQPGLVSAYGSCEIRRHAGLQESEHAL